MTWIMFGAAVPGLERLVKAAKQADINLVVAGTHFSQVQSLAYRYQLDYHICNVFKPQEIDQLLTTHTLVINALQPYPVSSQVLLDACLRCGCHYVDLSCDVEQLETLSYRHQGAQTANSGLLPGLNPAVIGAQIVMDMVSKQMEPLYRLDLGLGHERAFSVKQSPSFAAKHQRVIDFDQASISCEHSPQLDLPKAYRPSMVRKFYTWSASQYRLGSLFKRRKRQARHYSREMTVDEVCFGPQALKLWACAEDSQGQSLEAVLTVTDRTGLFVECLLGISEALQSSHFKAGFHRALEYLDFNALLHHGHIQARFTRSQNLYQQLKTPA